MYSCVSCRGESLRNWKPSKATVSAVRRGGGRRAVAGPTDSDTRSRHELQTPPPPREPLLAV